MTEVVTGTVTVETLLDEVEALLSLADNPKQPPRPNLSLPTAATHLADTKQLSNDNPLMVLQEHVLKGRGWFAKVDIPAGTMLVCEKPLAMVMDWQDPSIDDDDEGNDDNNNHTDFNQWDENDNDSQAMDNDQVEPSTGLSKINELLLIELLRLIVQDPSFWTHKLSHLFPRTDDDLEGLERWNCTDPSIQSQWDHWIDQLLIITSKEEGDDDEVEENEEAMSNTTKSHDESLSTLTLEEIHSLSRRLPLIVRYNVLSAETSPELLVHPSPSHGYAALSGTALYYAASFFNHDSRPNVSRYTIGDVLWVVTNQHVSAGQELCLSYLEHDVLCEAAHIRTGLLQMDFDEPQDELTRLDDNDIDYYDDDEDGPLEPVVTVDVQNELMQMDPMERLETLQQLLLQAMGEDVPEDNEDEMASAPWFQCDVQNLRILQALTFDSLGQFPKALEIWEHCVVFCETHLPPNDESAVVVHVQAALCAQQGGEWKRAKEHADRALAIHHVLFGGGVHRFRRRFHREFQLTLRPTVVGGGPDALWPLS